MTSFLTAEKDSNRCTIKPFLFDRSKRILTDALTNDSVFDRTTGAQSNDFIFESRKDSNRCTIKPLPF